MGCLNCWRSQNYKHAGLTHDMLCRLNAARQLLPKCTDAAASSMKDSPAPGKAGSTWSEKLASCQNCCVIPFTTSCHSLQNLYPQLPLNHLSNNLLVPWSQSLGTQQNTQIASGMTLLTWLQQKMQITCLTAATKKLCLPWYVSICCCYSRHSMLHLIVLCYMAVAFW